MRCVGRIIIKIMKFARYLEIKKAIQEYKEDTGENPFKNDRKTTLENRVDKRRQRDGRDNYKQKNKEWRIYKNQNNNKL